MLGDEKQTVAGGLYAIAHAIESLATQVKYLGNGDASTHMGAIEAYGTHMGEKLDALTSVLGESIEYVGGAIEGLAKEKDTTE